MSVSAAVHPRPALAIKVEKGAVIPHCPRIRVAGHRDGMQCEVQERVLHGRPAAACRIAGHVDGPAVTNHHAKQWVPQVLVPRIPGHTPEGLRCIEASFSPAGAVKEEHGALVAHRPHLVTRQGGQRE